MISEQPKSLKNVGEGCLLSSPWTGGTGNAGRNLRAGSAFGLSCQSPKNVLLMSNLCSLPPRRGARGKSGKSSKDGIILSHGDTNKHSHTLAGLRFGYPKSSELLKFVIFGDFWALFTKSGASGKLQLLGRAERNSKRIFIYSLCPELCGNYDKTNLFWVLPIAMETHMENSSPRPLSMRNPGVQPWLTD